MSTPDRPRGSVPGPSSPAVGLAAPRSRVWADRAAYAEAALPAAAAVALVLGAVARLHQFFAGRSLWFDESALALNILDRSLAGLTGPLDFDQGAPLGFLLSVKVLVLAFGPSEEVLRLVPLVAGLAALPLFYVVARTLLPAAAMLVAVVFFAAGDGLIYYSAEAKQYSLDVAVALALLGLALVPAPAQTLRRILLLSAAGATAFWISHPSVFVLMGIFAALGIDALLRRRWNVVRRLAFASPPWLLSFAFFFVVSSRNLSSLTTLIASSDSGFARPVEDGSFSLSWGRSLFGSHNTLLAMPGGDGLVPSTIRALFAGLLLVGGLALLRRRRVEALALGLPIALMLLASQLGRYPTFARTVLFTVPAIVLFASAGVAAIATLARPRRLALVVGTVLALAVTAQPVLTAAERLVEPRKGQEIEPLLTSLVEQWRDGDTLYVHYGAQPAFRFYADCGCADGVPDGDPPPLASVVPATGQSLFSPALRSNPPHVFAGVYAGDNWQAYVDDVARLRGHERVWILYTHRRSRREGVFLAHELRSDLDKIATRQAVFESPRAGLLLYDFSTP